MARTITAEELERRMNEQVKDMRHALRTMGPGDRVCEKCFAVYTKEDTKNQIRREVCYCDYDD